MTWVLRGVMLLTLGVATWKVQSVRAQLAEQDTDPEAVSRLNARLTRIPLKEGPYTGTHVPMSDRLARLAGADTFASIDYADGKGRTFHLYVGGSVGNEENFHAPSYCMPAAGWETLEASTIPFVFEATDRDARMRRLVMQHGSNRMLVYFWFQAGDVLAHHEWLVRYYRFLDLLAGRPLLPTLIVTVHAPVVESVEETERALRGFLATIGPSLQAAIREED